MAGDYRNGAGHAVRDLCGDRRHPGPRRRAARGAAQGVDDAGEFGEQPVAGGLDDAPPMLGEARVDQFAPQVGAAQRVIVVDVAREGEKPQPLRIANPEILWRSEELMMANEGCLSLPEHYADVERPAAIRLRYLDHENEIREIEAKGLLATCLQHEIDHLDGVLFVDHISSLKRGIILRKLAKTKKSRTLAAAQ